MNHLVKNVYQLQATQGVPASQLNGCLKLIEQRLQTDASCDPSIQGFEIVNPGQLLDPGTMLAIGGGTHVKQPLGVVVHAVGGRILSKAKVICS